MRDTVDSLEQIFKEVTETNYPHEWDENHITYSLMKRLREFFEKRDVHYKDFSKIITWASYKNKGKTETTFGDISIIVNIQFSSGEKLTGVAFLEAKRDFQFNNFESIVISQLQSIVSNAPYGQLLLYKHNSCDLPLKFPDDSNWRSNIFAAPLNTAIQKLSQLRSKDNSLVLRVSIPFSMQILSRYFWGHDLDYRPEILHNILTGLGDYQPRFINVVNVYYEGQNPVNIEIPQNWESI